jgi:hypothetical protein
MTHLNCPPNQLMVPLILLYLLLALTGIGLVSRSRLRGVLDPVLMIFTFGAAQLLVVVQLLSLFSALTPLALLGLNALATTGVMWWTRRRIAEFWKTFRAELKGLRTELRTFPGRRLALVFVVAAGCGLIFQTVTACLMYPMSDIYHFVMPLFWTQNHTLLPFPAYDPRLIGVVFASEALCLPGYMFAHTAALFPLMAGVAAGLAVGVVMALARQIGAGRSGAICAGALLVGYGPLAYAVLGAKADMLVSALWFGASIHFLLRTKSSRYPGGGLGLLGCSVFSFSMACGAKNAVLILLPVYGVSVLMVCGRALLARKMILSSLAAGGLGLLISGVVWSYTSNLAWFGDARGPQFLKETLARDLRPQAVWTRLTRGTVMLMSDVIWLPGSCQKAYANYCQHAVGAAGGSDVLSDDNGFYSFRAEDIRPGTSFGLLGILVFVPSLVFAGALCLRGARAGSLPAPGRSRRDIGVLVWLTLGSFVTYHILLRWQTIGISRLMLPCLLVGTPLAGLLLDKARFRLLGLPLLLGVLLAYSVFGFSLAARRLAASEPSGLTALLARLQRSHGRTVEWQWPNAPAGSQEIKEGYTRREIVRALLQRLPQPTTFGLIGNPNAEGYYLFGDRFQNKVVSLQDARGEDQFVVPSRDVQYVVLEEFDPARIPPGILREFDLFVKVVDDGQPLLVVFQRSPANPAAGGTIKSNQP